MREKSAVPIHLMSGVELLFALAALFILFPLIGDFHGGTLIESVLLTIVLILAVLAVSVSRRVVWIAALLALARFAGRWLHRYWPNSITPNGTRLRGHHSGVQWARMLAATETMTGLLYVVVLIARLVAIHSTIKSNEN